MHLEGRRKRETDPIDIGMDQSDVVVASDDVSEGRESLFDALHNDGFGQRVSDVEQFLVGTSIGEQQALGVSCRETTDDVGAGDAGLHNGKVSSSTELIVKHPKEVLGIVSSVSDQGIFVGELGKHPDFRAIFELGSHGHMVKGHKKTTTTTNERQRL